MSAEQFANLAETTLASGYTAGGSTLAVASASLFPSTGPFRVSLGNTAKTIWRVDSVSGTTFTGGAEANDGNASTNDTVKMVASKAVAERFLQSPDSGEARSPSGAAGAVYYGPLWKLPAFDPTGWTWDNQGASVATIALANGIAFMGCSNTSSTENNRMLYTTAPSTPYKFSALLIPNPLWGSTGQAWMGLALRDSGGKIIAAVIRGQASGNIDLHVRKLTNSNSFSADAYVSPSLTMHSNGIFIRVGDNGTNVTFEFSFDGFNWFTGLSETRGTFFTTGPNAYGLLIRNATGSGLPIGASFLGLTQE
jgi:hypothetical protein